MHTKKTSLMRTLAVSTALFTTSAIAGAFPDFGFLPGPKDYSGKLFELSQNYPTSLPNGLPDFFKKLPETRSNDFETWRDYMQAAQHYCLNMQDNAQQAAKHAEHQWYHMPWQHYGPLGREGISGLTKEAAIAPFQLAASQSSSGQTYAVGLYNAIGAYTIGQVWKDPQNPDPKFTSAPNSFPHGTVVCKALFADIPLKEVPFLQNPILWKGYITETFASANRVVKDVALIQMDIAVRDERVSETGWLFGTFQYNGAVTGAASWENLVPVGIMWGNDPQVTDDSYTNPQPKETRINPALLQTAINADKALPPTHLGWNGRLNGPVDNPVSSCLSCHMTAEYEQKAIMNPSFQANPPAKGSAEWMQWFQNIAAGHSFTPGTQSSDYSLQLAIGLANFYDWKCNQGGVFVDQKNVCAQHTHNLRLGAPANPNQIKPIVRDPSLLNIQ